MTPEAKKPAPELTRVIIINNLEAVHTMHVPPEENAAVGAGEKLLVLLPGANIVDAADLAACRKNKGFDAKFKQKIERHVAKEAVSERVGQPVLVQGKNVPEKVPLSVLNDEEAKAFIEESTTVEILQLVRDGEGRTEVRAAIDDRIRFLETGVEQAA